MWISRHSHNNSLIVFLHGLGGSRWGTWKEYIDALQRLQAAPRPEVRDLRNYDIYAFDYPFGSPLIPDVLNKLKDFLRVVDGRYDTLVLIGHSQGGILAKLYVLDALEQGRGLELKVDLIITLDTPHRGPRAWFYPIVLPIRLWNSIWGLRSIPLGRQIGDLAVFSDNLKRLRAGWNEKHIATDPCPAARDRRYIRSYWFPGTRRIVVSEDSAHGLGPDRRGYQNRPWAEMGLADETNEAARLFEVGHQANELRRYRNEVARILREHDKERVDAIRDEIQTIRTSSAKWKDCCNDHVADLTELLDPTAKKGTSWTATCLLRGFLMHFSSRPLRSPSLKDAVRRYASLSLRELR